MAILNYSGLGFCAFLKDMTVCLTNIKLEEYEKPT